MLTIQHMEVKKKHKIIPQIIPMVPGNSMDMGTEIGVLFVSVHMIRPVVIIHLCQF